MSLLQDVYNEIYGDTQNSRKDNLIELAARLSKLARRQKPWTYKNLDNIMEGRGAFRVTRELDRALMMLASQLDGGSPLKPLIREITMYTVNGLDEYAIVLGHSKRCEGCAVLFVPNVPWRRFCCDECREDRKVKNVQ